MLESHAHGHLRLAVYAVNLLVYKALAYQIIENFIFWAVVQFHVVQLHLATLPPFKSRICCAFCCFIVFAL